jgi:endonuclease G
MDYLIDNKRNIEVNKIIKITSYLLYLNTSIFAISPNDFINQSDCDQIIEKNFLIICYDYNLKAPTAVSYTLHGDQVNELNIEERPYFKIEPTIEREYRASYDDYTHSGYDRGHLAPDAAFDWSEDSLEETYSLANIIPQARKVNRYTWTKAERYARFVAVQRGWVNVINVVKYSDTPLRIGSHGIAVPNSYYKVLYSDDQTYTKCLYYANDNNIITGDDRLTNHEVNCNELIDNTPTTDFSFLIPILMILN